MYESAEIRWFFSGTAPTPVTAWFTDAPGLGVDEPARTDRYLLLPGCTTVSVKVRQGNFEVKALVRPPRAISYGSDATGYCDQWVKWSSALEQLGPERLVSSPEGDRWLLVRKRRHLRKFSLDAGSPREVDAAQVRPEQGCQVELTAVDAVLTAGTGEPANEFGGPEAERWWSLSLEAFGDATRLPRHLDRVADAFFAQQVPVRLTRPDSMSYPVWIARVSDPASDRSSMRN